MHAYLVEFRSWGGQSGSPVLVHRQLFHLVQVQLSSLSAHAGESRSETVWAQSPRTEAFGFLGLVSGHFDIEQHAQTSGDIFGSITTAINSGIAIVTPAEAVRQLLWRDDVTEDRQQVLDDLIQARAQGVERLIPPPRHIISSESASNALLRPQRGVKVVPSGLQHSAIWPLRILLWVKQSDSGEGCVLSAVEARGQSYLVCIRVDRDEAKVIQSMDIRA